MKRIFRSVLSVLLAMALLTGMSLGACATENKRGYSDVAFGSWYYNAVDFMTALGAMNGVGGGKFAPNSKLTRAMTVTILYRLDGSPDVSGLDNPFEDISEGTWYTDPVKWAFANEITLGTSKTNFSPSNPITKEQLACFVIRYAQSINAAFLADDVQADQCLRSEDEQETSPYALEAMKTMMSEGLYMGDEHGYVHPKKTATRAETATVFWRLATTMNQYPCEGLLIYGEDCLEKSFDSNVEDDVLVLDGHTRALLYYQLIPDNDLKEVAPVDFEVFYRFNFWGTEYQLPQSTAEFNGMKVILPNGTVHYLTVVRNSVVKNIISLINRLVI